MTVRRKRSINVAQVPEKPSHCRVDGRTTHDTRKLSQRLHGPFKVSLLGLLPASLDQITGIHRGSIVLLQTTTIHFQTAIGSSPSISSAILETKRIAT